METHCSILAWEIPWTEDPCGLQSLGLQRVGSALVTKQQEQQTFQVGAFLRDWKYCLLKSSCSKFTTGFAGKVSAEAGRV